MHGKNDDSENDDDNFINNGKGNYDYVYDYNIKVNSTFA